MPDWLALYLEEDLGAGDLTGEALFAPGARGRARMVARERLLACGLRHTVDLFARVGCRATPEAQEGAWAEGGATLLRVEGPARGILAAERTALNLVARMSGIASATRELADRLRAAGLPARVAGTRKTTPGFRAFEKEAIRAGGGDPHRMGLFDEAMVKDNHLAASGEGAAAAVRAVRSAYPGRTVTCEVESLDDALAAAGAGADWLLIDNQPPATARQWAEAVRARFPAVRIEASGGIRPDNLLEYGWADRVSLGWLTQKVPARDVALDWDA